AGDGREGPRHQESGSALLMHAKTDDGIKLYYEEAGSGTPLVFVHEFGGDHRSWEPQMRCFARRHRCISFAARGYPPSDVPESAEAYSQLRAVEDIVAVMDAAKIERAHVVGLSMGGFATLHLGLEHPERALEQRHPRLTPTPLVMLGDEEAQCLQRGIFLRKTVPACGLLVLPKTGHTLNLEEPEQFNAFVGEFIATVEAGRWLPRNPRAMP